MFFWASSAACFLRTEDFSLWSTKKQEQGGGWKIKVTRATTHLITFCESKPRDIFSMIQNSKVLLMSATFESLISFIMNALKIHALNVNVSKFWSYSN